jgi:hypothetical protein
MRASIGTQKRRKSGAALAFVIIVLAVITIFSILVAQIVAGNLKQAKAQELELQAYYVSVSGSELCLSALLQEGTGGVNDTLLFRQFNPSISTPGTLTDHLVLDGGAVDLTVSATVLGTERWVVIRSTATLADSATTKTTTLEFQYSNPLIQKKS